MVEKPDVYVCNNCKHRFQKAKFIDTSKHMIIKAPHPSPLSAYRGFFGSRPFSKVNDFLIQHNKTQINWCLG